MFRQSRQGDFFDGAGLMTPHKRAECARSWAGPFRDKAWPLLLKAEPEFSALYDPEMGRPNRSVALLLGAHILKEMSDLTDREVLEALKFDMRWWYAFELLVEELDVCEKTLRNFRAGLMKHEKGALIFRRITDDLIRILGLDVSRQRLDSTHILSNFARLNRLGLFCETMRVFLNALKKPHRGLYDQIPGGIVKRHGEEAEYADARRGEGVRRLEVAGRDAYRLVKQFEGHRSVSRMEEFRLLQRLVSEQCEVTDNEQTPKDDDDDRSEGKVPVRVRAAKEVPSSSLQTPHDPEVTYSGHKGKGYSVQISETCAAENPVQLMTHVETTPACQPDQHATVPVIESLAEAKCKPEELAADTNYSGAKNAAGAAKRGVNLLAPAPAKGKPEDGVSYPVPAEKCPTDRKEAGEWLKRQEAQPEFEKRYAVRAGIEGTNSELKRAHGAGKLRVRGGERVALAVYLKATACNLKRAMRCWLLEPGMVVEAAALPA